MTKSPFPRTADYIIVGGGLAGCVLASRLSRGDASASVVLIEAGQDPAGNPMVSEPLACFSAHYSEMDWAYSSVSDRSLTSRFSLTWNYF